eukprot:gene8361-186_t
MTIFSEIYEIIEIELSMKLENLKENIYFKQLSIFFIIFCNALSILAVLGTVKPIVLYFLIVLSFINAYFFFTRVKKFQIFNASTSHNETFYTPNSARYKLLVKTPNLRRIKKDEFQSEFDRITQPRCSFSCIYRVVFTIVALLFHFLTLQYFRKIEHEKLKPKSKRHAVLKIKKDDSPPEHFWSGTPLKDIVPDVDEIKKEKKKNDEDEDEEGQEVFLEHYRREIWELSIWDYSDFAKSLFCFFSPIQTMLMMATSYIQQHTLVLVMIGFIYANAFLFHFLITRFEQKEFDNDIKIKECYHVEKSSNERYVSSIKQAARLIQHSGEEEEEDLNGY